MSINFLKNIVTILVITFYILLSDNCFAWLGYDRLNGSEIEIGSGNLVREGEIIKFYDWDKEEDRKAEVMSLENLFSGSRLEIYDYVESKIRVFDME